MIYRNVVDEEDILYFFGQTSQLLLFSPLTFVRVLFKGGVCFFQTSTVVG